MTKYFLLANENTALVAVKPNVRRNKRVLGDSKYIPIETGTDNNTWLCAGEEVCFRVCNLFNIMYQFKRIVERYTPLYIHQVEVKEGHKLVDDEVGHHDGASDFSFYRGKYANSILITKTYDLSCKEDLQQLMTLGFFEDVDGELFSGDNLQTYFEWLVINHHHELFIYLYEKEPSFSLLKHIVLSYDLVLLNYILGHNAALKLSESEGWKYDEDKENIDSAYQHAAEYNKFDMLEILFPYVSNKLQSLASGLYAAIDESDQNLIDRFLGQLIQEGGRSRELLNVIHYVTPKEKLHLLKEFYFDIFVIPLLNEEWDELLVLALACESDELLDQIFSNEDATVPYKMDMLGKLSLRVESEVKKDDLELKDMVKQGNIFACHTILKNKTTEDLDSCLLIAAEKGFLGIVKALIENGANAKAWMNYPIKFANKHNYTEMKKYLIELNVPDEMFN